MLNDSELLRIWLQQSDESALRDLFSRHRAVIKAVCLRILRNPADVEDAIQETFIALARDASGITGEAGAWLRGVAVCKALKLRESARRRTRREQAASSSMVAEEDPETDLVDSCIELLSETERDLIVRHFYLGQTQKNIADASGLPPLVVHRRMKSALNQLRQMLTSKGVRVGSTAALVAILVRAGASEAATGTAAHVMPPASASSARQATVPGRAWWFAGWGAVAAAGSIMVLLGMAREDRITATPSPAVPMTATAAPLTAKPTLPGTAAEAASLTVKPASPAMATDAASTWLIDRTTFDVDDWTFFLIEGSAVGDIVRGMDIGDDPEMVALYLQEIRSSVGNIPGWLIDLPENTAIKILPKDISLPDDPAMLFELEVALGDVIDTVRFFSVMRVDEMGLLRVSTIETHRRDDGVTVEKLTGYAMPTDPPHQPGLILTGTILIRNVRFRLLTAAESQEVVRRVSAHEAAEAAAAEVVQTQSTNLFEVPETGD